MPIPADAPVTSAHGFGWFCAASGDVQVDKEFDEFCVNTYLKSMPFDSPKDAGASGETTVARTGELPEHVALAVKRYAADRSLTENATLKYEYAAWTSGELYGLVYRTTVSAGEVKPMTYYVGGFEDDYLPF